MNPLGTFDGIGKVLVMALCGALVCACSLDATLLQESLLADSSSGSLQLIGKPPSIDYSGNLNIKVDSNTFTKYKYKVGEASSTDCADAANYSADISLVTPISDSLGSFSDEYLKVCVVAETAGGNWQNYEEATSHTWYYDSTPVYASLGPTSKTVSENSGIPIKILLSGPKPYDISVSYRQIMQGLGQDAIYMVDHDMADGVATIPAGSTSILLSFQALDNVTVGQDKILRVALAKVTPGNIMIDSNSLFTVHIQDDDAGTPKTTLKVASNDGTVCAILSDHSLKCWGRNSSGEVGDGTTVDKSSPTLIDSGVSYDFISLGANHACGITSVGVLKCWGGNWQGQLGDGTTTQQNSPVIIDSGVSYIQVSAGDGFTCGVTSANILKCWGTNWTSQLGDGTTNSQLSPVVIDTGVSYQEASTGWRHACAITTSGVLKCWGSNTWNQLGDGSSTTQATPVVIDSGVTYAKVASDQMDSCGIISDGTLKCWGSSMGATPTVRETGVVYTDLTKGLALTNYGMIKRTDWSLYAIDPEDSYTAVSGGSTLCAIHHSGTLRCFGANNYGQMGNKDLVSMTTPVPLEPAASFDFVTSYQDTSCAQTSSGRLLCWGSNILRNLTVANRPYPLDVTQDGLSFTKFALTVSSGACGITSDKKLFCMILNNNFEAVDAATNYKDVSVRANSGCAVTETGVLKCWQGDPSTLTEVDTGILYAKVAVGNYHKCGITTAGLVKCWGDNGWGELGDGTQNNQTTPTAISDNATTYKDISVGDGGNRPHTCGVTTTNVLKCWGANQGGLGDGTYNMQNLNPTVIDSGVTYSGVYSGSGWFDCGITTSGDIKCWGYFTTGGNTPTLLNDPGVTYKSISTGSNHACGLTTGNKIKCWGSNSTGQLGNGFRADLPVPVMNLGF